MKASIKFSDNSKPRMRAKVPMTVLGFPFRSGIEAGDDLSLSLSSFFQSGPILKLLYRPYDSLKPFSIVLKTGLGLFGSPLSAPLTISAEVNVLGDAAPTFLLHLRPRVGDFSLRRSVLSQPDLFAEGEVEERQGFSGRRTAERVFSGMEVSAMTLLPVRDQALLKFRWRLKKDKDREEEIGREPFIPYGIGIAIPCLALSKVGIEHVAAGANRGRPDEVAEACLAVKKELQAERGSLRNAVDELRAAISISPLNLQPHPSTSLFSGNKSKPGGDKKEINTTAKSGAQK